jgi:hypothetical protein
VELRGFEPPDPLDANEAATVGQCRHVSLGGRLKPVGRHRALDGALGARWLAALTTRLENPLGMIA